MGGMLMWCGITFKVKCRLHTEWTTPGIGVIYMYTPPPTKHTITNTKPEAENPKNQKNGR